MHRYTTPRQTKLDIGSKSLRHHSHSNWYESGHLSKQNEYFASPCKTCGSSSLNSHLGLIRVSLSTTFSFAFYSADGGDADRVTQSGEDAAVLFDPQCTSSSALNILILIRYVHIGSFRLVSFNFCQFLLKKHSFMVSL